jgi:NAD(P)-dependent dehydrogenase (short-subunit alcohol dehydrogenase family)
MTQPICLITGATEGVGKVTAVALAQKGFRVVMVARNERKAEALQREIRASGGSGAEYLVADLASLRQVRRLADTFRARHRRLDVLINNAGVFLPERTETEDGFETTYQVNYLSHFVLTHLLRSELERSDQGRIINLSSSVYAVGRFDADNLQSERRFSVLGAYSASKLFMLMFTEELPKRLAGTRITANAVHPGIVRTQMMLRAPGAFRIVSYLSLPFSVSPEEGALTSVYLATSPEVSGVSGRYFENSRTTATKNRFDTEENRALLWDLSLRSVPEGAAAAARRAG